jgi:pimeloyl-ACP methyl ester carboxylesterase
MTPAFSTVPLADGDRLSVAHWRADGPPVLAIHGIGSTSLLWSWLHEAAPDVSLVAPDLRGRGASSAGTHGSSIRRHADDMVAVIDALGVDQIDVVGMSMGGFVAVVLGAEHPDRVRSITLVDGGLPLLRDPAAPITADHIPVLLADRFARKDQTWPSAQEYGDFFVAQTAPLLDRDDPLIDQMVAHDLTDGAAGGTVRLDLDALSADALDVFVSDSAETAFARLAVPTRLAFAQWSAGEDTPPMYAPTYVEQLVARSPALRTAELVEGVDHAAIIMSPHGAQASARVLRASLA